MTRSRQKRNSADRRRRKALLLGLQSNRCFWCPAELTFATATLDELIPRSRGGTQRLGNVVVACRPCNSRRGPNMPSKAAIERATEMVASLISSGNGTENNG